MHCYKCVYAHSRTIAGWDTAWIGLSDAAVETAFRWTDGSIMTHEDFADNQPSGGSLQNCVYLNQSDWKWYTDDCSVSRHFFCGKSKGTQSHAL